jgi:hypothetical protein
MHATIRNLSLVLSTVLSYRSVTVCYADNLRSRIVRDGHWEQLNRHSPTEPYQKQNPDQRLLELRRKDDFEDAKAVQAEVDFFTNFSMEDLMMSIASNPPTISPEPSVSKFPLDSEGSNHSLSLPVGFIRYNSLLSFCRCNNPVL